MEADGGTAGGSPTLADVFGDDELALATCAWVRTEVAKLGPLDERVARTQVTWRGARRGFAFVWDPNRWIREDFHVVLSIALERVLDSPRMREVTEVRPGLWQHHIVVRMLDDLDDEVREWLREAHDAAS